MMINKTRILNEFIELVSVPCPSKDEKAEPICWYRSCRQWDWK